MAFRSRAQADHFKAKLAAEEIEQDEYDEWADGTNWRRLPRRLNPKTSKRKKYQETKRRAGKPRKRRRP